MARGTGASGVATRGLRKPGRSAQDSPRSCSATTSAASSAVSTPDTTSPSATGGERHGGEERDDHHGSRHALGLADPGGAGHQTSEEEGWGPERDQRSRVMQGVRRVRDHELVADRDEDDSRHDWEV